MIFAGYFFFGFLGFLSPVKLSGLALDCELGRLTEDKLTDCELLLLLFCLLPADSAVKLKNFAKMLRDDGMVKITKSSAALTAFRQLHLIELIIFFISVFHSFSNIFSMHFPVFFVYFL